MSSGAVGNAQALLDSLMADPDVSDAISVLYIVPLTGSVYIAFHEDDLEWLVDRLSAIALDMGGVVLPHSIAGATIEAEVCSTVFSPAEAPTLETLQTNSQALEQI